MPVTRSRRIRIQTAEEEEGNHGDDYVSLEPTTTLVPSSPNASLPHVLIIEGDEEEEEEEGDDEDEEEEQEVEETEEASTPGNPEGMEFSSERVEEESVGIQSCTFSCPVCMEPWSSEGSHRTCCLPCGHIYGRSCIERWIRQCSKSIGRCPQCNRKCKLADVRNIYAPHVAVLNADLQKEVVSLRAENEFLKLQNTSLSNEVRLYKKRERDLELYENQKVSRFDYLSPHLVPKKRFEDANEHSGCAKQICSEHSIAIHGTGGLGYSCGGIVQKAEFAVDGAHVFDMDVSSQILVVCRKPCRAPDTLELTKVSLLSLGQNENVPLPFVKRTIKDIHISLLSTKLVLLASMDKTISIFSMDTNNIALQYNLPAPAWSCSWDLNNLNHAYAGLQNGMLSLLDLRQTRAPMECISGLSSHPVHTIYCLRQMRDQQSPSSAGMKLLTASSFGVCEWNLGSIGERPHLIPGVESQGVCISLACDNVNNDIVASFRPRVHSPNDFIASQAMVLPTPAVSGPVTQGSHLFLRRMDDNSYLRHGFTHSNLSAVRMQKSTIISRQDQLSSFACGDEATNRLCVREMPCLRVASHLKPHPRPILDVKFSSSADTGMLGCVSADRIQLFTCFEQ